VSKLQIVNQPKNIVNYAQLVVIIAECFKVALRTKRALHSMLMFDVRFVGTIVLSNRPVS